MCNSVTTITNWWCEACKVRVQPTYLPFTAQKHDLRLVMFSRVNVDHMGLGNTTGVHEAVDLRHDVPSQTKTKEIRGPMGF